MVEILFSKKKKKAETSFVYCSGWELFYLFSGKLIQIQNFNHSVRNKNLGSRKENDQDVGTQLIMIYSYKGDQGELEIHGESLSMH